MYPQAVLLISSVVRKEETYRYFLASIGEYIQQVWWVISLSLVPLSLTHATDKLNVVKEVLQPALKGRNIFYYDRTLRYEILEIRKLSDTQSFDDSS